VRRSGWPAAPQVDRYLVSAAVLSLLAELAEDAPLLCLVDDAHWLDAASAEALLFAARRLRAEPIAMLFAAREGDPSRFQAHGLAELWLEGVDAVAAAELLGRRPQMQVAPEVAARLAEATRGNPLVLLELGASLTPGQHQGPGRCRHPCP
jgi:hypothetical protein